MWEPSTELVSAAKPVSSNRPCPTEPLHEFTMADLAFVVATIACFALVALVARGVTKR
ncbi:hypothetical protein [Streptomyces guryensis]|uniref:Uncharacterized protein n=1 Tax=Streptomyces guryensis TaxID=2886947 RepID=A0A9Q3ZA47_9ACTN|nr:hypothetical protein [Streptomyces guryensis]MCD9880468.1 hypothetical protein [Streptomyces guryensis]